MGMRIPKKTEVHEPVAVAEPSVGTTYELGSDNVQYDEETGVTYVNNIIIVFFSDDCTDEDKRELIDEINGEVVGEIPVIRQCQIRVSERTLDELTDLCTKIEDYPFVETATFDQAFELKADVVQ
jgi:hypothetical protein